MKKVIMLLVVMVLVPFSVSAADSMEIQEVPTHKTWSIEFNTPLDLETITTENIYVRTIGPGNPDVFVSLAADGKTVYVTPKELYAPNAFYLLVINTGVTAKGIPLKERVIKLFMTKGE